MLDLPTKTLGIESDITMYDPPLEFWLNKIRNKEYFAFCKQLHGFWDGFCAAYKHDRTLGGMWNFKTHDKYIERLAASMANYKKKKTPWNYNPLIYEGVIKMMLNLNSKPNNFFFGVSDNSFYRREEKVKHVNWVDRRQVRRKRRDMFTRKQRQEVMSLLLPEDYIPFDGTCWKSYVWYREITPFFELIKDMPVVLIGPPYFNDFHEKANLNHYDFREIDYSHASFKAEEILGQTIVNHRKRYRNEPVMYLIVAGSMGSWLVNELHPIIGKQSFIIDIGRAFDVLYLDLVKEYNWVWLKKYGVHMWRYRRQCEREQKLVQKSEEE